MLARSMPLSEAIFFASGDALIRVLFSPSVFEDSESAEVFSDASDVSAFSTGAFSVVVSEVEVLADGAVSPFSPI